MSAVRDDVRRHADDNFHGHVWTGVPVLGLLENGALVGLYTIARLLRAEDAAHLHAGEPSQHADAIALIEREAAVLARLTLEPHAESRGADA